MASYVEDIVGSTCMDFVGEEKDLENDEQVEQGPDTKEAGMWGCQLVYHQCWNCQFLHGCHWPNDPAGQDGHGIF